MNFNEEVIKKAKQAKSVEELKALAKDSGMELTEEQAQDYFAQLNPQYGELADEELDNVAGGGCRNDSGNSSVRGDGSCIFWQCKDCHKSERFEAGYVTEYNCQGFHNARWCCICSFVIKEIVSSRPNNWYCSHPSKQR